MVTNANPNCASRRLMTIWTMAQVLRRKAIGVVLSTD
jgi:hypothetical protein